MRAVGLILVLLMLAGCSIFDAPAHRPDKQHVIASIELTDDLPAYTNGRARMDGELCVVQIRRSNYPRCITHEIMHCFGWRHDDKPNTQFCKE